MATQTKVIYPDKDAWLANTLGGAGNGKSTRGGVGHGTGAWDWQNRFAISFARPAEMATIASAAAITAFPVKFRVANELFGFGANVKFYVERATGTFTEYQVKSSEGNPDTFVSSSGPASGEWPGPDTVTTDRGSYQGSPADKDWISVDIVELARWWWAQPAGTPLVLVLKAFDEDANSQRCVFYTRESASSPYGELKWNDNQAPNIPTDLSPADGATIASTNGTSATVQARHTDPEANAATKYQAQWYPSSATDETPGTPTKDDTVTATTAHNSMRSHTFTGLPARTAGKWRMRFYDGQWGPWSLLRAGTTAYKPTVVNVAVQPGTTTPLIYFSIVSNDPAGDYFTAYQVLAYQDPAAGQTITKWDSGKVAIGGSPNRAEVQYGGSAIAYGTPYRLRIIGWNKDDVASDLTANFSFTQQEPTGAVIRVGADDGPLWDPSTKIDTLTPDLYISDPTEADIDQARVRIYGEQGVTLLFDSGVVSAAAAAYIVVSVPAGVLSYGLNPQAEAADRLDGNAVIGPYSQKSQAHVNAQPGAPYPVTVSGGQTVQRSDGVWVTTDSTPDLLFPFVDSDIGLGYDESPNRQEVEVRDDNGDPFASSPYVDDTDPVETFTSPTLTAEETYDFRARYDDSADVRSNWSDRVYVKYSAAPTLTDVSPADEDTVTDPTPTFSGTYGHTGGVAEASRRLILYDGQTTVYDSGAQDPDDITVPAFTLENETAYDYELISTNADGLTATATGTITTDFSVPDPPESLTLTVDDDEKAILVEWTDGAAALDPAEHEAHYVYAKSEGGQFRLVATVTDQDTTAVLYRAPAHNAETTIRVTQSNGWAESEPIEESETLTASGYWIKRPGNVTPLPSAQTASPGRTDHNGGDTEAQIETLTALGRADRLVLNWGATGYVGSFALLTKDRALVLLLRGYKDAGEIVIVATPYGASRYAKLTQVEDDDQPGGWITVTVAYIEVSPDAAGW